MRLKTYTARSMPDALAQIRDELGVDAIIVGSRQQPNGGIEVTAAADPEAPAHNPAAIEDDTVTPFPMGANGADHDVDTSEDVIERAIARTGLPHGLAEGIRQWRADYGSDDAHGTLSDALSDLVRFGPLPYRAAAQPLVLVGPPGSGKSTTAAKLAAYAVGAKVGVDLMSADTVRPAGVAQLEALAAPLKLGVDSGAGPTALAKAWRARRRQRDADGAAALTIVDTPGISPFSAADMEQIDTIVTALSGTPVLVLPAGMDAGEAEETAAAFADIGTADLIVSRLDTARRLGSAFGAATVQPGQPALALRGVGVSPDIAGGLHPVGAAALATLLLAIGEEDDTADQRRQARGRNGRL